MEGINNKLDLTSKKEDKQPLASYKAIPEADLEEEALTSPNKAVIKVKNCSVKDGEDEKMLSDDENKINNSNNVDIPDNKVIIKEKNGDAKLDIGELKSAFAGMTKEELMKYANDPFWIKIRWFLFVSFWLLWLGMLLGAIAIIYTAPKCDPPAPRQWWEKGPLVEIKPDVEPEILDELKRNGIQGVIVEWPEDSYAEFTDSHHLMTLLNKSKEIDVPLILDLEASMSNIWFEKSENRNDYEDFYIWKQSDKINGSGIKMPPNNWISRKNESAWKYSEVRKEFYYAPEGWPQLNFRNENVTKEFEKVLRNFAEKGIKGFRLRDAHILLVDANFEDQSPDMTKEATEKGYVLTDYGFYVHSKTENLLDLGPLLKKWRQVVKNVTNNGPFIVKNSLEKIEAYRVNNSLIVDLPSIVLNNIEFNAEKAVHSLEHVYRTQNFEWPLWSHKSLSSVDDVLDAVIYLLPGVPLLDDGLKANEELVKIRDSPPVMRGELEYKAVSNKTVLAFTRLALGSPGVLVAVNPSDEKVKVDFSSEMDRISDEVTIQFLSVNFNETDYIVGLKKESNNIIMSPKSSIVLTYTATKTEE